MTDKFLGVGGTDGTNARPLKMDVEGNLEVRDIDVKAELELIKDQQAEILARLSEPIDIQPTENITQERLLNSLAITDTNYVYYNDSFSNILKYKEKTIYIVNTLDKPINIYLRAGGGWGYFWDEQSGEYKNSSAAALSTIPAGFRGLVGGPLIKLLEDNIATDSVPYGFALKCDEAPTSGSITITFYGR